MPQHSRIFTRAEDELILQYSKGQFSLKHTARKLKTGRETVIRRAEEMGLIVPHERQVSKRRGPPPSDGGFCPITVQDDKLLKRLQLAHGDREILSGGNDEDHG